MTIIVKLPCDGTDYYLKYNTVGSTFCSGPMTREELLAISDDGYFSPERIALADKHDTSYKGFTSAAEFLEHNACGDDEATLTIEQIVDEFIRKPLAEKRGGDDAVSDYAQNSAQN
jgi:hypothetical protein